jgi:hypothetical protein
VQAGEGKNQGLSTGAATEGWSRTWHRGRQATLYSDVLAGKRHQLAAFQPAEGTALAWAETREALQGTFQAQTYFVVADIDFLAWNTGLNAEVVGPGEARLPSWALWDVRPGTGPA